MIQNVLIGMFYGYSMARTYMYIALFCTCTWVSHVMSQCNWLQ